MELFYSQDFDLKCYKHNKKLKRIISELVANVNMHGNPKNVYICGYYDIINNLIKVSIFSLGITIRQNIESNTKYNFSNDETALLWSIKKSNSTRKDEEIGGLGLYLTRKYMCEMGGRVDISSGKSVIIENKNMDKYNIDIDKEANVSIKKLKSFIPGCVTTLIMNFEEVNSEDISDNNVMKEFEKIMEEIAFEYEMYN